MVITSGTNQPINFSTTLATTLTSAGAITLTSAGGSPTASNQAVTITATGNLKLNGNFDAGTGDVVLSSGGIPSPTSFLTDDITLTFTGSGAIAYPRWMGGAGRNVTLIAETAFILGFGNIDLSEGGDSSMRGDLTVRALVISPAAQNEDADIIANNISITDSHQTLMRRLAFNLLGTQS